MKMMKKAGFTLVELIVVITILAILGTIAFISLQGNTQDAKNSKVTSDLRTIASAIEIATTRDNDFFLKDLVDTATTHVDADIVNETIGGGNTMTGALIGIIDFAKLRQNSADFKDPEGENYIAAYTTSIENSSDTFYQIAGQTREPDGSYKSVVKGNYVKVGTGDATGLIDTHTFTTGVTNGEAIDDGFYK